MAFLTDRAFATGVTANDLIHIVITGDTSQNPAGSSYKATMGQVLDLINPTTITGGTYDPITGTITFYDDTGGSFDVTGLVTGYTNTAVTAFTYDNANTFTIFENDGSTHSATFDVVTGLTINGNLNVTGTTLTNVISATTYQNLPIDIYTTGATYSNNTFTYTNNSGGTYSVLFNTMTGLTINGNLNVTGNTILSATTASTLTLSNVLTTSSAPPDYYLVRDSSSGLIKQKVVAGPTVYGLFAQTANSVSVSATTVETTIIDGGVGTLSVPANGFVVVIV